jgi:hypothetical protein
MVVAETSAVAELDRTHGTQLGRPALFAPAFWMTPGRVERVRRVERLPTLVAYGRPDESRPIPARTAGFAKASAVAAYETRRLQALAESQ